MAERLLRRNECTICCEKYLGHFSSTRPPDEPPLTALHRAIAERVKAFAQALATRFTSPKAGDRDDLAGRGMVCSYSV
jgi:hypothetical protein